jgi:hypothetical protein
MGESEMEIKIKKKIPNLEEKTMKNSKNKQT